MKSIIQDSAGKYREPVSGMRISDRGANRAENENKYREAENEKLRKILAAARTISEAKALVKQYLNSNHGWGPSRAAIREGVAERALSQAIANLKSTSAKSSPNPIDSKGNRASTMLKMGFKV